MRVNLQTVIKVAVSLAALGILVYLLRGVDLAQTLGILLGANLVLLSVVLLLQVTSVFLRLLRWKYQLLPAKDVRLTDLLAPLLISYAVGNVMVTAVGALPRTYLLNRRTGIDNGFISGTWVQEYILDATALLLWAVTVPFLVDLPMNFRGIQLLLVVPLALLLLIDFSFWRRRSPFIDLLVRLGLWERFLNVLPDFARRNIDRFADGLSAAFSHRLNTGAVVLTTALIWVVEGLIFWLLLLSLKIPFDFLEASAVMAYTHAVIGVPAVPGFVGTLEASTITLVLALGGAKAAALAFSVLLRVFLMVPSTLVGILLAWHEGWRIGAG